MVGGKSILELCEDQCVKEAVSSPAKLGDDIKVFEYSSEGPRPRPSASRPPLERLSPRAFALDPFQDPGVQLCFFLENHWMLSHIYCEESQILN